MTDTEIPSAATLVDKIDRASFNLIDKLDELVEASATRDAVNVSSAIANLAAARARLQEPASAGGNGLGFQGGLIDLAARALDKDPRAVLQAAGVIPDGPPVRLVPEDQPEPK